MSLEATAEPIDEAPWRRLSVLMLLVHPLIELVKFAPAVLVVLLAGRGGGWSWWSLLGVGVPVALGVARWLTTRYRTTETQVQLWTGLINRNILTARLDRVRSVDLTASPLHRILGLTTVHIGTGAETPVVLDALRRGHAETVRSALLHHSSAAALSVAAGHHIAGAPALPSPEVTLARFSPTWLRFAPFTLTGLVAVGAVVAFGLQFIQQLDWAAAGHAVEDVVQEVIGRPWWLLGLIAAAGTVVILTFASLLMYAVTYGGFRLTRQAGGTLHVVRGLLTTRATTLEERRLRGAVLREPFLMRPIRGAQADALVTGSFTSTDHSTSRLLMPPAPQDLVVQVLARVTEDPDPWQVALRRHGRAATLRRYIRAVVPSLLVPLTAAVASSRVDLPAWAWGVAALPVLASVGVGRGRADALGHSLTERYLVSRSGMFPRRRAVLVRDGIIGWVWSRTLFQRRRGLVTLRAMTAAAPGYIDIIDVPDETARDLVAAVGSPGLAPFLEVDGTDRAHLPGRPPVG